MTYTAQSILHTTYSFSNIASSIQNHSQIEPTQMQIRFLQMQCDQSIWILIATWSLEIGGYPQSATWSVEIARRSLETPIWSLEVGGFPQNAIVSVDTFNLSKEQAMRILTGSRSIKTDGIIGSVTECACASFGTRGNRNQINRLCWSWKSHHSYNCLLKCACYWILCRSCAFHVRNRLHCVSAMELYIYCPCNRSSWCNVRAKSLIAR